MKRIVLLFTVFAWCAVHGQSKKDQIASQQFKLDSLTTVNGRQLEQIQQLQQRQVAMEREINELYRERGRLVERMDSMQAAAISLEHQLRAQTLRYRGRPVDTSDPLNGISLRRTVLCYFSSPTEPDRFDLEVHGTELPTSLFWFFIRSANGMELHRSEVQFIRTDELTLPDDVLSCLITQRMEAFLSEERFRMVLVGQDTKQRSKSLRERTHIELPEAVQNSIGPLPTGNVFLVQRAPGNDLRIMFMSKLGLVMELPVRE